MNRQGALFNSLNRNSGQIKKDRAEMIQMSAERYYRRMIEDIDDKIKGLEIARDSQLDMSPNDINKIIAPDQFDAKDFCDTDAKATMEIRDLKIKKEELEARYEYLFGARAVPVAAPAASTDAGK